MSKRFPHKVKAAFNEANKGRLERIINAKDDMTRLKDASPSFIVMDLTWDCNYECMSCIDARAVKHVKIDSKTGQKKSNGDTCSVELPVEIIRDVFDYGKSHGLRGMMTMGGEVFSYEKGIRAALEKSVEHQIPMKTVTNGSLLGNYVDLVAEAYRIEGSMLRVSINADRNNYHLQTGQIDTILDDVTKNISRITSQGVDMFSSTVVFPKSAEGSGQESNIDQIENIMDSCEDAGIASSILLPGRDPSLMKRFPYSKKEKEILRKIKAKGYAQNLYMNDVLKEDEEIFKQNLNFKPCYAGFLYTLIGSSGNVYICSDHRGNPSAVLGHIEKPGDFEKFWHSEKRVQAQYDFVPCEKCCQMTCIKYDVNRRLSDMAEQFSDTEVIPKDLIVSDDKGLVFI